MPAAADDYVTAERGDPGIHATPFQVLAEVSLEDGLHDYAEGVERGADAEQDQTGEQRAPVPKGRTSRKPTVATVVTVW